MTMGMWNDENGEKCLTKNILAVEANTPESQSLYLAIRNPRIADRG